MGPRRLSASYVDASALVKLFKPEPETRALVNALAEWEVHLASELIVVEALCAAKKLGDDASLARAAQALDGLDLLPFDERIRNRAAASRFAPPLRALDAIHLASAIALEQEIDAFVAYDSDLCAAAENRGLPVVSPR